MCKYAIICNYYNDKHRECTNDGKYLIESEIRSFCRNYQKIEKLVKS